MALYGSQWERQKGEMLSEWETSEIQDEPVVRIMDGSSEVKHMEVGLFRMIHAPTALTQPTPAEDGGLVYR